jgi:hypothetical protein
MLPIFKMLLYLNKTPGMSEAKLVLTPCFKIEFRLVCGGNIPLFIVFLF